jgi:hypothetical protein
MEFIHPWYMVAGGALISSPILIHLINRMRFKRIRWAAMEFLLKSQKRNRRRLIIEQMILLLLRILLVLLAGFLVARLLYAGDRGRGATHVVVLDDTLSMADRGQVAGREQTAFAAGKEQILELVRVAADAPSAQFMSIYLLSELDRQPLFQGRLARESRGLVERAFQTRAAKPTFLHVSPRAALEHGRGVLASTGPAGQGQKVLHFVSDFRDRDWTSGPEADKIVETVRDLVHEGVHVNLVDVAAPYRARGSRVVQNHDNLAIVDFQSETRVAVEDAPVEFTVSILNHGTTEPQPYIKVMVNGQVDQTRSQQIDRKLGAGQVYHHKFTLTFPRKAKPGQEITERDGPDERERKRRLEREFYHVRVDIGAEQTGLNADNVRDLVVEVRRKVPALVIDGTRPENKAGGDMTYLEAFFTASAIYDIEERRLSDLAKADLDLYPCIILLNVPEITDAKVVAKLKNYVEQGGSLCYFLGEEVRPENYNTTLFGAGLFPVKIGERPYDPLLAQGIVDPDARNKEREQRRQTDRTPKILFPNEKHAVVQGPLYSLRFLFRFLSINVYWQAQPRSQWDPGEVRRVEELVVLPNSSSVDRYKDRAKGLVAQALTATEKLATREAEMKKFVGAVDAYKDRVRDALAKGDLFQLAEELQSLLSDAGVKDDPTKPNMTELWRHQSMRSLAAEIKEFRETVLYGDPLLVSKTQGRGRVVAMLMPAGPAARKGVGGEETVAWNNWGSGEKVVQSTYPLFMMNLLRYLVTGGHTPNRTVGEPIRLQLDPTRYERKVSWTFVPQPDLDLLAAGREVKVEEEKGATEMAKSKKMLDFTFKDTRKPGLYRLEFTLVGDAPEDERKEARAYVFNTPAEAESNLKRATRERLQQNLSQRISKGTGSLVIRAPGSGDDYEQFKEKQPDASESPWLYLFFIIILIVEQAMAVHLSFHLKGSEAAPAAPARPAAAAA